MSRQLNQCFTEYAAARASFEALTESLYKIVTESFPQNSVALHHDTSSQFVIICQVDCEDPTKVGCLFENGNVWYKDVIRLTLVDDKSQWPTWVRDRLLDALPGRRALREEQDFKRWQKQYQDAQEAMRRGW